MSVIFAALIASTQVLPFIDRVELRVLARFEASQDPRSNAARAPSVRDARKLSALCSKVGKFVGANDVPSRFGQAYSVSGPKVSILKSTCADHLASVASPRLASLAAR